VAFHPSVCVMLMAAMTLGCDSVRPVSDGQSCGLHVQLPPGERFERPADKGVELYSWASASGDFRFALLWGTNREKATDEIQGAAACTFDDVAALKARLNRLAKGEQLFWLHRHHSQGSSFAYPPSDVVEAVRMHCTTLGIAFHVLSPDDRVR
jgi:hypothetical protein